MSFRLNFLRAMARRGPRFCEVLLVMALAAEGVKLSALDAEEDNWGFEKVSLQGWRAEGGLAGWQPTAGDLLTVKRIPGLSSQIAGSIGGDYWRDLTWPVGHKGDRWISTAMVPREGASGSSDEGFDESWTGTVVSKSFVVEKNYISFLVGGQSDPAQLQVQLLLQTAAPGPGTIEVNGEFYEVVTSATGHGKELMRRAWWDIKAVGALSKIARLRIVDNSTTGHLNVDDIRFQDTSPSAETILLAGQEHPAVVTFEGEIYDWDSPVWGFADLHTHPMSYLGFGGKVMHGPPDGGRVDPLHSPAWLSNCNANHGGWGLDNPQGNYWRQILMAALDDAGPEPHGEGWDNDNWLQFSNWPLFTTISHQQMWFEWIKRARDGGLRVMVALCVNNNLLGAVSKGDLAADDKRVGDAQISELKAFVGRHNDFMEIAYDPFQLRDIVRRGKLAVIIGSELDDIGNLARSTGVKAEGDVLSKLLVSTEIQRLHANGVRYIFPIHLVNNKFGGTAIAGLLLNMANKYLNGAGFEVTNATAGDNIEFWLENVDFRTFVGLDDLPPDIANMILASGAALGAGLVPIVLPWIVTAGVTLGPALSGGTAMSGGLAPLALLGAASLLPPLLTMVGVDQGEVIEAIIPLPGNFPIYPEKAEAPHGVRNKLGLTKLGRHAVEEMMKLGMMIDVDHMSQSGLEEVLGMATNAPGGYPINSGHNGFREIAKHERTENNRTLQQIRQIRDLGGLMGVGWENAKGGSFTKSFRSVIWDPAVAVSEVANNCAGSSKTFAQSYLLALEGLGGGQIALGTDIDGFVISPGPRFGPQSAFGLATDDQSLRYEQIKAQTNGVLYEPRYGPALTTAAFRGRAMEAGNVNGFANRANGYAYTVDQADFFAAMSIFYWLKAEVEGGRLTRETTEDAVRKIAGRLSRNYPDKYSDFDLSGGSREHIANYSHGLLAGIYDWQIGDDLRPDKTATTKIGKAVYRTRNVAGYILPAEIAGHPEYVQRLGRLLEVWDDYQKVFGNNTPMKRCKNAGGFKEWDFNFEGVAHYGLLPDFLQDLKNVGIKARDMSALFRSAEDFARMWTRSLAAASPPPEAAAILAEDTELEADDTSLEGRDVVVDGKTLVINGTHTFKSLTVVNGGVVTHPPATNGTSDHLTLTITGNMGVDSTSSIDVSGKGFSAGTGPGAGTFDGWAGSGAGYGAAGGSTERGQSGGAPYGSSTEPVDLGSGGGTGSGTGPYITYVETDDEHGKIMINGSFGSARGEVFIAGVPATILNWSDKSIVCSIPDSGPGSAGEVIVSTNSVASNSRYITEWRGGVVYELRYNDPAVDSNITGVPRLKLEVQLHFRADVQPYRLTPSSPLTNRSMFIYSAAGDSTCHWQVDGGFTNSMGGTIFYGETWNSSGTLKAAQPVFYMLNGIMPDQRTMAVEFDLQFEDAFRPASMFGLMAPDLNPDRNVQLGYAMGPSEWDSGAEPYPLATWDPKTYELPAMDKGPTVITMIPGFPWFSIASPMGPKCTTSYHRDSFVPTAGTIPPPPAGMGGGALRLVVQGEMQLEGKIRADGIAGKGSAYPGGGGSGGSVYLGAGKLTGGGKIQAIGGDAGGSSAGAGSGGRIVIKGNADSFAGQYSVAGGSGTQGGAAGTLEFGQQATRPVLTITSVDNKVVLSWPEPAPGWTLEWAAELGLDNAGWTAISPTLYVTNAGTIGFTETMPTNGCRFYRLRKN